MATRPAKRTPQRTCVGCRRTADQRDFVRLVRSADGAVAVDREGRAGGRGASLCPNSDCWRAALKGNRLAGALRTTLSSADRERLQRIGESLVDTETGPGNDH